MEILPYARSPDEEFTGGGDRRRWAAAIMWQWANRNAYVNGPKSFKEDQRLCDCVRIRRDTDKFGFIFNVKSGVVFYADMDAIQHVTRNLQATLASLQQKEPQLLRNLEISV